MRSRWWRRIFLSRCWRAPGKSWRRKRLSYRSRCDAAAVWRRVARSGHDRVWVSEPGELSGGAGGVFSRAGARGEVGILDCSKPGGWVGRVFGFYFRHLLPWLGARISGDAGAYGYLPDSVAEVPAPPADAGDDAGGGVCRGFVDALHVRDSRPVARKEGFHHRGRISTEKTFFECEADRFPLDCRLLIENVDLLPAHPTNGPSKTETAD